MEKLSDGAANGSYKIVTVARKIYVNTIYFLQVEDFCIAWKAGLCIFFFFFK